VLKIGGTLIVSTENGSSWHNIFAAVMGWQIFSLTNVSRLQAGLGNPIGLLRGADVAHEGFRHKVIFNYRGLVEICAVYGFEVEKVLGAGYYPLPASFGRWDVRHSHFLSLRARKNSRS
jgi:hypothetical protein